jgi:hypothetical protein
VTSPPEPAWIVLHRDVSEYVKVDGASAVFGTMVLDLAKGMVLASQLAPDPDASLREALHLAMVSPADGREPAPPAALLCAPDLARQVAEQAVSVGADVVILAVDPPLEAENMFDALIGHLVGRGAEPDFPTSTDWSLLYEQTLRYADRRPWKRISDDTWFGLHVIAGDAEAQMTAVVLGNAGIQSGLVLCPEGTVPFHGGRFRPEEVPGGTLLLSLDEEVPPDLRIRAARYGWPSTSAMTPTFFRLEGSQGRDINQTEAHYLSLALAAILAAPSDPGEEVVAGELELGDGVAGVYKLTPPNGPGYVVLSGEVRDELARELEGFRLATATRDQVARLHPQERWTSPQVEGDRLPPLLPLLLLEARPGRGPAASRRLLDAAPVGLTVVELESSHLMVLVGEEAIFGIGEVDEERRSWVESQLDRTDGVHGVLITESREDAPEEAFGLFLCRLAASGTALKTRQTENDDRLDQLDVPDGLRPVATEVLAHLDDICQQLLDDDGYRGVCELVVARLAGVPTRPLERGRPRAWATSVVHLVCSANRLIVGARGPHLSADQLASIGGVTASVMRARTRRIRQLLAYEPEDPALWPPARLAHHPTAWIVELQGRLVDARNLPRREQRRLHDRGLIPDPALLDEAD